MSFSSPAPTTNPLSALEAQALFHDLADNGRIPFNMVQMGCNYRAFQMHAALRRQEVEASLVLAVEAERGSPLAYTTPQGVNFNWWYHVAVAVPVITETGEAEACVFDPAIFDGPVRVSVWADRIGARHDRVTFHRYDDVVLPAEDSAFKRARLEMVLLDQETVYERTNELLRYCRAECETPRQVYASHVRRAAEAAAGHPFMRQGRGWSSVDALPTPPSPPKPRGTGGPR